MNILKWVLVIAIAYVAGYFSHFPLMNQPVKNSLVSDDCPSLSSVTDIEKEAQLDRESLQRVEKRKQGATENSSQSKTQGTAQSGSDKHSQEKLRDSIPPASVGIDPASSLPMGESNITDEEIDNLVAAPFNETLKKVRGPLREKYKSFAEATEQNDWDINTQNRMTDALLGNQYSKFIELESLICRADYCEIRGRELKPNVFSLIMSEMMLQDWWKMGHSQWTNGMDDGTFYALITKAPGQ
ncbi:MAG TPA: hypothetical protein VL995_08400 [Cellvibrio sp.]|nr:hypothetical protein [Cellvibrio sp.]